MVSDIEKRIAYADKKAKEREIKAQKIKNSIFDWPEFLQLTDIYVYVGGDCECGYLSILDADENLNKYRKSPEKIKFEKKFLNLAAITLGKKVNELKPMLEYDSQENLDKNYGGQIAKRLAE